MKRTFKRVMAVHDLSGLGRSSLMAATPVLSVMGAQVCPVPTAVLSSQTSGFENYTFVDLTIICRRICSTGKNCSWILIVFIVAF